VLLGLGKFLNSNKNPDKKFISNLNSLLGFKIKDTLLFKKAFTHSSTNLKDKHGSVYNYERLEFLGDSILGTIISDHIYSNYSNYDEGELTKLRSKIINRESLNKIGFSLKLNELVNSSIKVDRSSDDINGNLLEALIGAIYIEKGFKICQNFVIKKIINNINLNIINKSIISFKASLVEWSQKNKKKIIFKTKINSKSNSKVGFSSTLFVDNKKIAFALDESKKKAEEKVSKISYQILISLKR
tara:strand:- start:252 stop:983 length:732 start_codon:yes stop_codon:yes gene_type:complete